MKNQSPRGIADRGSVSTESRAAQLPPTDSSWHDRGLDEAVRELRSHPSTGLVAAEAALRLAADGPNELRRGRAVSPWLSWRRQFSSLVIWVLIGAAAVSVVLGEVVDGVAIMAIVVLNAAIGFFQEYRAERAAAALARMTAPRARVVRDGALRVIPAVEVVRGDLLYLEAGDVVAADARLTDAAMLRTAEAALTGESEPVEKHTGMLPATTPLADRRNMVFLGTSVVRGSARALVVATGMDTEIGHIARLLDSASDDLTPLQRRLDQVARRLLWGCFAVVLLVFALGFARGIAPFELFLGAVGLGGRGDPRGVTGGRDRRSRPGRTADGASQCARAPDGGGGDARLRAGHLHGQDRYADRGGDDGAQAGHRTAHVSHRWRGLRSRRRLLLGGSGTPGPG